jgi:hypothetical protein
MGTLGSGNHYLEVQEILLIVNKVPQGMECGMLKGQIESTYRAQVVGMLPLNPVVVVNALAQEGITPDNHDIVVPGGKGDRLHHVWRRNGQEVVRATEDTSRVAGPSGAVRLRSTLEGKRLPISSPPLRGDPSTSSPPLRGDASTALEGHWSLDVETEDGQLVGRTTFTVIE